MDQPALSVEEDDRLGLACGEDLPDPRHRRERLRDRPRVLRRREDVDVVDGLLHPSQAPGRHELFDRRSLPQMVGHHGRDRVRVREEEHALPFLEQLDAAKDFFFRLLAEPLDAAEPVRLRGLAQRLDVRDAEFLPQELHLFRPDPAHPQHVKHSGREPRAELLVVSDLARRHVLLDLLSEGRTDPRDRGHPSLPHEILHVLRERLELPRGSPV